MGLTTALYTGLSGLTANSESISVTGNNIANLNTTAFKASRVTFETQILDMFSPASGPSKGLGGTNPVQVGLGTNLASVTQNFSDGALVTTGVASDLAIEGNGFFVVELAGVERYTRAGNFQLDRDFNLVNPDGGIVQGFGVDSDFNVIKGVLTNVNIPIGVLTSAEMTQNVTLGGNLNADGDIGINSTVITSDAIYSDSPPSIPALTGDMLNSLYDVGGNQLFMTGDVITITGATKGGTTLPDRTFEVGPNNTTGSDSHGEILSDFNGFLEDVLGIDTAVSGGVSVIGSGQIVIRGNTGTVNDIELAGGNIIVNRDTNPTLPFGLNKDALTGLADGESVRTSFVAYDTLGTPLQIEISMVLENKTNAGTTWRYYAQSNDDTDLDRVLGNGQLNFDINGKLVGVTNPSFTIDRTNTGALTPQQITLGFSGQYGSLSGLTDTSSQMTALSQDGSPIGTLQSFNVKDDGTISGVFSNSLIRDLGQIVLAKFTNPVGLVEAGGNLFDDTANSGIAAIVQPGSGGTGRIVGGALELSNTELSNEFINLINASTGFTASSRILTTSDRLIQELLATVR